MAYNQQLSVLGQVAPATTGTAGQVLVSAGSSASSYWASAIPVSAYSAQFNNANYLTVPTATALNLASTPFTIEAWVYIHNYTGYNIICAKRTAGSVSYQCYIVQSTGWMAFYNGTTDVRTSSVVPLNTWTHLAWVHDGTNMNQYFNGVRVNQTAISITDQSVNLNIGSDVNSTTYYFPGHMSNFRIIKGVAVYTGTFTPPTSPLGTSQAAGTNIAAVSASQTSLLTCNGPGFTDSSPNAFTISNIGAVITSQFAPFSSFSAISRSATQTQTILTSGSGTYYTPSGVAWLRIRMVGGGGGGAGGGGSGTDGSAGANTTFGTSFLVAGGGGNGLKGNGAGGSGGTSSIASGATGISISGGSGEGGGYGSYAKGGDGGESAFGGAGKGAQHAASIVNGGVGATNSGAGGGGGSINNASADSAGSGGGSGGYVEAYISSPAASYAYTVGAGGGGGAGAGQGGAGAGGGSGVIIVEENYAVNASGGGGVLQVQSNTLLTAVSTTSTSMTSTGLTVSITPKFSTSKILIKITGVGSASDANANQVQFQIVRNYPSAGTVANGQVASGYNSVAEFAVVEGMRSRWPVNAELMDSPGTTSTITYTLNISVTGASGYLGRWGQDANWNAPTTITLMEIAQ